MFSIGMGAKKPSETNMSSSNVDIHNQGSPPTHAHTAGGDQHSVGSSGAGSGGVVKQKSTIGKIFRSPSKLFKKKSSKFGLEEGGGGAESGGAEGKGNVTIGGLVGEGKVGEADSRQPYPAPNAGIAASNPSSTPTPSAVPPALPKKQKSGFFGKFF